MENNLHKQGRGIALLPFIVFVVIYLSAGIYFQMQGVDFPFFQFPCASAVFIATILAFIMTKEPVQKTFSVFAKGAANADILTMLMIYLLAGAFSSIAPAMGARDAVVNLGLSVVPAQFLAAGIFIISGFMGTATGSSMGTISALMPVAAAIAEAGGLNISIVVGACIGGAMFGDNLSMISDTTIAATRTQHCELKDKFRVNLLIALPAAIITVVLLLIFGRPETTVPVTAASFSIIKVIPYIAVLGLALFGLDVFLTLSIGIFSAGLIGIFSGAITLPGFTQAIWSGFTSMDETFYVSLFCGGLAEIVAHNGGILWLTTKMRSVMKGNRSAQGGVALLSVVIDCATANNTVAIILSGSIAREVSREYKIDPRRTASLLDVFACAALALLPYSAQVLVACNLANSVLTTGSVLPTGVIGSIWYCYLLGVFGVLSIFVPYADGICRKDPWNWEYDCAESAVASKKALLEEA